MIQNHLGPTGSNVPLIEAVKMFSHDLGLSSGCRGRTEKSNVIADIIGVNINTVSDWMLGTYLPKSERKAKLLLLLFLCGYETQERSSLNNEAVTFSDIVATTTGIDQAVSETSLDDQKVRRFLHSGFYIEKEPEIQAFIERYSEAKDRNVFLWRSDLEKYGFLKTETQGVLSKIVEEVKDLDATCVNSSPIVHLHEEEKKPPSKSSLSAPVIKSAASMVLALKPLVDLLLSGESDPETRDLFREMAGQRNVFDLKNGLTRLCGETAFKNN